MAYKKKKTNTKHKYKVRMDFKASVIDKELDCKKDEVIELEDMYATHLSAVLVLVG